MEMNKCGGLVYEDGGVRGEYVMFGVLCIIVGLI